MQTMNHFLKYCLVLIVAGLVVAGCGRKGPLQAPPSQTVETVDEQGRPIKKEVREVPDRPFILDGLI